MSTFRYTAPDGTTTERIDKGPVNLIGPSHYDRGYEDGVNGRTMQAIRPRDYSDGYEDGSMDRANGFRYTD
jgi:hypothetical protein